MTYQNLRNQYTHIVNEWLKRNNYTVPVNTVDVITSILLHRDRIIDHGGSFVQAFINNNLHGVISFADEDSMANLRIIYQAFHNIDTYYAARAYREILDANPTL